jgi:hypothetical protein
MPAVNTFYRSVGRSLLGAAALMAWDGMLFGSVLMSMLVCPVWFLLSLIKNAVERPGWGLALARLAIPALTLAVLWVNKDYQIAVAKENAPRVVAALEKYHADNGKFPKTLDELVPQYLLSVPVAKHCLYGRFEYLNYGESATPILYWVVVPPHLRNVYNFETKEWRHLE